MEMLFEIIGSWVLVIGMIVLFGCNLRRSNGPSDQACFANREQPSSADAEQQKAADVELETHSAR